ncbi:hypothetical protein DWW90_11515 [Parabacteroides sp. AF17-28]|nr:hypothetical protein DWW90_11515 [Parabacteroides sp. AF17-28]
MKIWRSVLLMGQAPYHLRQAFPSHLFPDRGGFFSDGSEKRGTRGTLKGFFRNFYKYIRRDMLQKSISRLAL